MTYARECSVWIWRRLPQRFRRASIRRSSPPECLSHVGSLDKYMFLGGWCLYRYGFVFEDSGEGVGRGAGNHDRNGASPFGLYIVLINIPLFDPSDTSKPLLSCTSFPTGGCRRGRITLCLVIQGIFGPPNVIPGFIPGYRKASHGWLPRPALKP
jgi:hypothetical protein